MENGKIRDNQITASTHWDNGHRAPNGRLNFRAGSGRTGAWSSRRNDRNQWLQVDFQRSTIITGISTQGRQEATQFIKSYTISFSDDGKSFRSYKPGRMLKVFNGNSDRSSIVNHVVTPSIKARFIRIHPRVWYGHISMRAEFYGCSY
ncbi:EGF-like repeat and discoidin I-like domain-containing 3 [Paramuricea clavata]|uniref:EGF-like repeat and discoidin I-like domain-containing 3 n=1 Tax=Paramuricea clavata TaxID=317549 RepID=A0A6S7GM52_PARCT|nr:EGF-like repeat and discoidin I-like domain-containing 3 [Paramuricea clavata]